MVDALLSKRWVPNVQQIHMFPTSSYSHRAPIINITVCASMHGNAMILHASARRLSKSKTLVICHDAASCSKRSYSFAIQSNPAERLGLGTHGSDSTPFHEELVQSRLPTHALLVRQLDGTMVESDRDSSRIPISQLTW